MVFLPLKCLFARELREKPLQLLALQKYFSKKAIGMTKVRTRDDCYQFGKNVVQLEYLLLIFLFFV